MKNLNIPVGISDFERIRELNYYYVDKTGLIKTLLQGEMDQVTLITRPRRFGKTMAMNMLNSFLDIRKDSRHLFKGLEISDEVEICEKWMNQYPTLFLSFKDVDGTTFENAFNFLKFIISEACKQHVYLLDSDEIDEGDKLVFQKLKTCSASMMEIQSCILRITNMLKSYYKQPVILLIDEYDVPLAKANQNGYYDEMALLLRNFFENVLKTNDSLEFAVLTGCLRIAKESIFTGLNNLQIFSIMSTKFDDSFGFTQEEINVMLECYDLTDKSSDIAHWYDGYKFNDVDIYNPWSVLNYLSEAAEKSSALCKPYWSNTSSNEIVKRLIEESNDRTKNAIEELINGTPVRAQIYEDITYGTIDVNSEYIWSFLLFTGYLKVTAYETIGDETYYEMVIPNTEVKSIYKNTIRAWFEKKINADSRTDIIESIIYGEPEKLEKQLRHWLLTTISYHDEQESYYHGFVTGLVSGFADYEVLSNIESGEGRFDLVVKQRSDAEYAAILEFKIAKTYKEMSAKCDEALRQIEEKNYIAGLQDELYRNISKYGICFCKKRCQVKFGGVDRFEY